jgi:hypothetical protein
MEQLCGLAKPDSLAIPAHYVIYILINGPAQYVTQAPWSNLAFEVEKYIG